MTPSQIETWDDINAVLDELGSEAAAAPDVDSARRRDGGIAFLAFDYGIDGVTIEIAKYASCFERELRSRDIEPIIHCIGGDFHASVDQVLAERWRRKRIEQANGWSKWEGGAWFDRMFGGGALDALAPGGGRTASHR